MLQFCLYICCSEVSSGSEEAEVDGDGILKRKGLTASSVSVDIGAELLLAI